MHNNETAEEKRQRLSDKRKALYDLYALEADGKKLIQVNTNLQGEIRLTKLKIAHLEAELEKEETLLRASDRKVEMENTEIAQAKKKANSV